MRRHGWLSANRPVVEAPKSRIRKGDRVVIIAGKDRGKSGKVLRLFPDQWKVTVEKINIIKRHTKPNQKNRQGGILEREGPIALSNVMLYCTTCQKPRRMGVHIAADGTRTRRCKKCGQPLEAPAGK